MSVLQEKISNSVTQAAKPSFLDKYTKYMALAAVPPEVALPDLSEPAQPDVAENNADRLAFADIGQTVDAAEWARLMAKHGRPQPEDTRPPLPVELWYAGPDAKESWRLFNEYREVYQCRRHYRDGVYCVFSVLPVEVQESAAHPEQWARDVTGKDTWVKELSAAFCSARADLRQSADRLDRWLCGATMEQVVILAAAATLNPKLQFLLNGALEGRVPA